MLLVIQMPLQCCRIVPIHLLEFTALLDALQLWHDMDQVSLGVGATSFHLHHGLDLDRLHTTCLLWNTVVLKCLFDPHAWLLLRVLVEAVDCCVGQRLVEVLFVKGQPQLLHASIVLVLEENRVLSLKINRRCTRITVCLTLQSYVVR